MAYPILGTPVPQFLDSNGDPYVSGTITTQDPTDDSVKASYPTAADADASTNGTSGDITLDAEGKPTATQYWGRDGEDYKVIVKDSAGAVVDTMTSIRMPAGERKATVTFSSADATPSVANSRFFITAGSTAITDFDDGQVGDTISIRAADTITIVASSSIRTVGLQDFTMRPRDTITFSMFTDQVWTEVGRSINSDTITKKVDADESYTSSTLTDSTNFVDWILGPAQYYKVDGYIAVVADAAGRDLEIDFVTDQAFQNEVYSWISVDAGSALTVDQAETSALTAAVANIDIDGTALVGIILRGFVKTHATATANVDVQFANQAGTGTVTVKEGSWISFSPFSS